MDCATKEAYRNGARVYICTCGVVKCHASENVTPDLYKFQNANQADIGLLVLNLVSLLFLCRSSLITSNVMMIMMKTEVR